MRDRKNLKQASLSVGVARSGPQLLIREIVRTPDTSMGGEKSEEEEKNWISGAYSQKTASSL